ncbi:hypothetical protein MHU86_16999 [Fragilaria crotonensis]|nr:hypothetical protein MHU86_16999 [Fragilaria crotonensis]
MRVLSPLLSILLASTSTDNPKSVKDVLSGFQSVYAKLQEAPIYKDYSSSIKFSFVPPSSVPDNPSVDVSNAFAAASAIVGGDRPVVLYLPGLDCVGLSGVQQFEDLSSRFELWRMTVSSTDRSSFSDLVNAVVNFVEDVSDDGNKDITLIGESFGGLLAPAVALKLQSRKNVRLQGLVLVNPATSFDNSSWDTLGPLLTALQIFGTRDGATPYTVVGGMVLSALVPDSTQARALLDTILGIPVQSTSSISEFIDDLDAGFGTLGKLLPPGLVFHRVRNWLKVGAQMLTEERLSSLDVPTLVVAGEDDNFLPSKREAQRLTKVLPRCKTLLVKGAGHFVLDSRVNLTEAIVYSDIDPLKLRGLHKYDPITDWKSPETDVFKKTVENVVAPLRRLASPVFISTDRNGKRWMGLGKLPSGDNPIVFVANHQLFGLDVGLIVAQLIEDRGIVARGLAHPIVFSSQNTEPNEPTTPGIVDKSNTGGVSDPGTFRKFGAVKVTPRNYYRLLQTGQNVLLFPGGVREVFHGKNEAHTLFWPDTPDFVRSAVRFNATIVTISAVGAADSANILVDAPDLAKLPFGIGEGIVKRSANVTAARFDRKNDDELFVPPLFVPKLPPARHYFVFGKPFSTGHIDHRSADQCTTLYQEVKRELERGFDDVLQAREFDPFKDSVQRLAYEQVTGKSAPTFSIEVMNQGKSEQ